MRAILITLLSLLLLSSCNDDASHYNGYIDADMVYLSSDYPGRLATLVVQRGQEVHTGQLLFKLEQDDLNFSLDASKLARKNLLAQKKVLQNQTNYSNLNYRRIVKMRKADAASQDSLEKARTDLLVLRDKLQALSFQIQQNTVDYEKIQWQKQRKEAKSLHNGIVFDTYFTQGEYIQAGQPLLSVVTKEHIKVVFYVPEIHLSQLSLGQKVNLSSDGNAKLATGVVSYISKTAQYTPPIIYSKDERSSLVFRVEARIVKPDLAALHLGQPVTLEVLHG